MKNKSMNKILALGVVAAMTAGMLAGWQLCVHN